MRLASSLLVLLAGGTVHPQETGVDPVELLDRAAKAQNQEACRLLTQAVQGLAQNKKSRSQAEMDVLTAKLARAVEKSARTQKDVRAIFGEKTTKSIARQIYYGRYLEQWLFEQPVRITVVFDCIKGREPKVLTVFQVGEN